MSLYLGRSPRWSVLLLSTLLVFLGGGSLFWWRTATVQLIADGRQKRLASRGLTAGQLLGREHVLLGAEDFVTPSSTTFLTHGMTVKVTRVTRQKVETLEQTKPVIRDQLNTAKNLRRVLAQKGSSSEIKKVFRVTFYDGVEVERKLLHKNVKRNPFYTLSFLDEKGRAIKTYDLLKMKSKPMVATGYYVGDPLVPGDETFLGYKLRHGLVAVDPKVIPLRTRLYIPGYGYGYAADTGSRIKGDRIDLAVKDRKEERRYMHRKMTVYILEKARKW